MDIERALDEPRVGHENLGLKGDTLLCETNGYNHGDNLYITPTTGFFWAFGIGVFFACLLSRGFRLTSLGEIAVHCLYQTLAGVFLTHVSKKLRKQGRCFSRAALCRGFLMFFDCKGI